MVDDLGRVGLVEARGEVSLGDSQTHGVAKTLTEGTCATFEHAGVRTRTPTEHWHGLNADAPCSVTVPQVKEDKVTRGDLHALSQKVLGVAGGAALPLPELLQVIHLWQPVPEVSL